ncbi:MAG: ATP-binding protein [archaeon]
MTPNKRPGNAKPKNHNRLKAWKAKLTRPQKGQKYRLPELERKLRIAADFYNPSIVATKRFINELNRMHQIGHVDPRACSRMFKNIRKFKNDWIIRQAGVWQALGEQYQNHPLFRSFNPESASAASHNQQDTLSTAGTQIGVAGEKIPRPLSGKPVKSVRINRLKQVTLALKSLRLFLHVQIAHQRIFSGKVFFRNAVLSDVLEETMRSAFAKFRIKTNIKAKSRLIVKTDPYVLGLTIENILTNAAKAVEPTYDEVMHRADGQATEARQGEINITIGKNSRGKAYLSIRDNGSGIDKEKLGQVVNGMVYGWEGKQTISGGVGMPLVSRALHLLGNVKLSAESEVGKFTEFTLTFD